MNRREFTRRSGLRARSSARLLIGLSLLLQLASAAFFPPARAQTLQNYRDQGRIMLGVIKGEIKKSYYDPTFRGIDIEARFRKADEDIKQAASLNEILGLISDVLIEFKDTHTVFIPPARAARIEHGWQMQMIGNRCYVVAVKPDSDAEAKGLRPGDRVVTVDGFRVSSREGLWKLNYVYNLLSPRTGMQLVVEKPGGKLQPLNVVSKVVEGKILTNLQTGVGNDTYNIIREIQNDIRYHRHRYYEIGDDFFIWKMPQFDSPELVSEMMDKVRKRKALILDLRGNGGGAIEALTRLVGSNFDRDVKVGDMKRRKETKPLIAKTRGDRAFGGKIVVLVDSESASSAELFARTLQLEKRGVVIGDRTAGAVMISIAHYYELGNNYIVRYGASVTDADIIMPDGASLETAGVTPDEVLLPTAEDLAAGRDPVLAHAARLVGLNLTPEKAGTLFPVEWRPIK